MLKNVVILVTIFLHFSDIACEKSVGDKCLTHENVTGVCTVAQECQHIKTTITQRKEKRCGFDGKTSIICCPPLVPKNDNLKRISERMCAIYSDCSLVRKVRERRERDMNLETTKTIEFPHMVGIGWKLKNGNDAFLCEGSLVSENFVLTAAHCSSINQNDLKSNDPTFVRVGERNLIKSEGGNSEDIKIIEINVHPKYTESERYHDIALMKLEKSIIRSVFKNPACLWRSRNIPHDEAIITGWGNLDFTEGSSNDLRKKNVKLIDGGDCSNSYKYDKEFFPRNIISEQLCATDPIATNFTCNGGVSSPLQIKDLDEQCAYILIGITAFGAGCDSSNHPAVYTRISSYVGWIEDTVWET